MAPHTSQTRQQILQLCQLHLQAALTSLGMQAKDIQNQCRTVNNLDRFAHSFLKIGLLRGRQVIVEDNNIRIHAMHQTAQLLDLSGADKRFGIGLDQALRQACNALGPSSVG